MLRLSLLSTRLALLGLLALGALALVCLALGPTLHTGSGDPQPVFGADDDPVIIAAGDIAACGASQTGDEATAALVAGIAGTVLLLGDNVYPNGTASEFANCYNPSWGASKARTLPVPGNHEYNTAGASGYYGYFGAAAGDPSKGYYSYDLGTWHLIALNSECAQIGGCGIGSPQETWLQADLAANQLGTSLPTGTSRASAPARTKAPCRRSGATSTPTAQTLSSPATLTCTNASHRWTRPASPTRRTASASSSSAPAATATSAMRPSPTWRCRTPTRSASSN